MTAATKALLAHHGLHCTRQRAALYEALEATQRHPTAEELYREVKGSGSESLSLATVYSTLETFCRVGLARKVPTVGGSCRYDATTAEHVHLRNGSGEIRDVPVELGSRLLASLSPDVLREIERSLGVRIDTVDIQLNAEPAERGASRPEARRGGATITSG